MHVACMSLYNVCNSACMWYVCLYLSIPHIGCNHVYYMRILHACYSYVNVMYMVHVWITSEIHACTYINIPTCMLKSMVACSFIIKFHLRRDACKNYVYIFNISLLVEHCTRMVNILVCQRVHLALVLQGHLVDPMVRHNKTNW